MSKTRKSKNVKVPTAFKTNPEEWRDAVAVLDEAVVVIGQVPTVLEPVGILLDELDEAIEGLGEKIDEAESLGKSTVRLTTEYFRLEDLRERLEPLEGLCEDYQSAVHELTSGDVADELRHAADLLKVNLSPKALWLVY